MVYSYGKTAKKGLFILVEVIIAGVAAKYGGSQYWFLLAPGLEMVRNWLKHRND